MVRNIHSFIQNFITKYLGIISIIFLVSNFIIWYINDPSLDNTKYNIYTQGSYLLVAGLILSIKKVSFTEFVKENIFFILVFIISLFNSVNNIMEFNGIVVDMGERSIYLILEALPSFLFILGAYKVVDKKYIIIALNIVLVIVLGYVILAILKQKNILEVFLGIDIKSSGLRHQSILNNPNAFGEYAFIGIYIAFFLSFISNKTYLKILYLMPILILSYGLILSGSRTALFMTLVLYLMINLYFNYHKGKSKIVLIVGNMVLLTGVILIFEGVFDSYLDTIRADMNLTGRDTIWINSLQIINQNIFKGIGYNNFTFVYNEYYNEITSPHNMLIGITAESGLIATILVIFWFVYIIIRNHNVIIKNKDNKYITYLILFNVFYVTYFVGQLSENSLMKFSTMNTLFFVLQGFNHGLLAKVEDKSYQNYYNYLIVAVISLIYVFMFSSNQKGQANFYMYGLTTLIVVSLIIFIIKNSAHIFISRVPLLIEKIKGIVRSKI